MASTSDQMVLVYMHGRFFLQHLMVKLHDSSKGTFTHKVPNIYSNDGKRDLFIFSDPPLIKTARNCLASKCYILLKVRVDLAAQVHHILLKYYT